MNILVFEWILSGHHLEFLHHIYKGAIVDRNNNYFFMVPESFVYAREEFVWNNANNITICTLTTQEEKKCNCRNLILSSWYKSLIIRKYACQYDINKIWLIMIMYVMPFLPFLLPTRVKISGILYRIYLYDEKIGRIRLLLEKIRLHLLARMSNIEFVYVLNDKYAQESYNRIYKTEKFKWLPDPIPIIDAKKLLNIREKHHIASDCKLFVHFGDLDTRKGTLEILKAITLLNKDIKYNFAFIIAGRVNCQIKHSFYELIDAARERCQVEVYDKFCSYEFLYNICFSCDCILVPYENVVQSSGVIGYAGFFGKPVIGPTKGLLGELIKKYQLGISIEDVSANSLKDAFCLPLPYVPDDYKKTHTVEDFVHILFQSKL